MGRGHVFQYGKRRTLYGVKFDLAPEGGIRKQKLKRGFKSEEEAQAYLEKKLQQVRDNTYVEPSKITFEDYSQRWLKFKFDILKASTCRNYESYLNQHVHSVLGSLRLQSLALPHLKNLISTLAQKRHAAGGDRIGFRPNTTR